MPVPLAAGLYGVLLGLGFTTFILTFAVWALAGMSVALGDPALGRRDRPRRSAPAGAAGDRARARRRAGRRGCTPRWPSARASCARCARSTRVALAACAVALVAARGRRRRSRPGVTDPSVDGALVAWHLPGAAGECSANGDQQTAPAAPTRRSAAAASPWLDNGVIDVQQTSASRSRPRSPPPGPTRSRSAPSWSPGGRTATRRRDLRRPARRRRAAPVAKSARARPPRARGRQARLHVDGRTGSRIVIADLATGKRTTVRRERRAQLLNPSLAGGRLLYVRDLQAPAAADRPADQRGVTQRPARSTATSPPGAATRATSPATSITAKGPQQASVAAPQAGPLDDDCCDDRARRRDAPTCTRLRQLAGQPLHGRRSCASTCASTRRVGVPQTLSSGGNR